MAPATPVPNNPWFGVSMALIGVIVGYAVAAGGGFVSPSGGSAPTPSAPSPSAQAPRAPAAAPDAGDVEKVSQKDDHIRGDKDALISVIEYSDFECPFCKRHHPTMEALMEEAEYEGKINWVYRHFPLSFHPNAQSSAEASECAGEQGKFWEYADMLFDKGVKKESYVSYAEDLGLNVSKFEDCIDTEKYAEKVKEQMAAGSAAGVRGTPGTVVLNNKTGEAKLVSGAQGVQAFKAAIDSLL